MDCYGEDEYIATVWSFILANVTRQSITQGTATAVDKGDDITQGQMDEHQPKKKNNLQIVLFSVFIVRVEVVFNFTHFLDLCPKNTQDTKLNWKLYFEKISLKETNLLCFTLNKLTKAYPQSIQMRLIVFLMPNTGIYRWDMND